MSNFADNSIYYFSLEARENGMYIVSNHPVFEIRLDVEILSYYLKHYTLQKGLFSNSFRKILCDDGEERYFNNEHPEYKASVKAETLSIKDVEAGTVLEDREGKEYIYIGSFYTDQYRRDKRKRWHYFYREDKKSIDYYSDLKYFNKIVDIDYNYEDVILNFDRFFADDKDIHFSIR